MCYGVSERTDRGPWEGIGRGKIYGARSVFRYRSSWYDLYLSAHPNYPEEVFRQRFRIPRTLLLKVKSYLVGHDAEYCSTRVDGIGRRGIQSEVKYWPVSACFGLGADLATWMIALIEKKHYVGISSDYGRICYKYMSTFILIAGRDPANS